MPSAVDLSSWNSLWTIERINQTSYKPTLKETIFEFNLGYFTSAGLSICFVTLGAYLMFGTGIVFNDNSAIFANQVIQLYTESIGTWSKIIITISSFSIMFGTCIAVFDGYARSEDRCIRICIEDKTNNIPVYSILIWMLVIGSMGIISQFGSKLKQLVDLATTISFLIAPFVAIANTILVSKKYISFEFLPPAWLKQLAIAGIIYLIGFGTIFVYIKII